MSSRTDLISHSNAQNIVVLEGDVISDTQAINIFLQSYKRNSLHTVRSYEKECFRFLLWLKSTHTPSPALLPRVTVQEINSYLEFLGSPRLFTPSMLDAAITQSNGWRHQPFRIGLSDSSIKHCIIVLHKMFEALRNLRTTNDAPFCQFNPVVLAHDNSTGTPRSQEEIEESLTLEEWNAILSAIEDLPRTTSRDIKHYHRSRWIMQLLYRSYLRRDEAAKLKMNSFEPSPDGWSIRVIGKGNKPAKIIATDKLMDELSIYRASFNLSPLPHHDEKRPAIMAVTGVDKGVTAQAIYLTTKVLFELAAQKLETGENANGRAAQRLRQASTHWMRHTGITHAMESGINPRYVQAQARHSSLNTTARYDHKDKKSWRAAMEAG